jgi:tetratricopeptide (TPR) repeat protein
MTPEPSRLSDREEHLQEIVAGYLEGLGAGGAEDRQALLARHPEFAAELAEFFGMRDRVDGVAVPLRQAVQGGHPPEAKAGGAALERIVPAGQIADLGQLGDFRIVREVGRGGMGVVYEAEQVSLRRRVALKVLPLAATLGGTQLQRFHNEARAAAGLHHTNIVPVHFVGCERGVHFYAMQFIDGLSLAAVLARLRQPAGSDPMPPPADTPTTAHIPRPAAGKGSGTASTQPVALLSTTGGARGREYFRAVAELGVQAAEALDYGHRVGVVHRDVKPGNLLLDGAGRLWVTDFGLAHIQGGESLTATGELVGTLRYMSPEQALGKRVVIDHRTDVYSLGATLYELLTLRPPFGGADRHELLRQIAFEEPRPPRKVNRAVPAELEVIVLKAVEKSPAERYGTAQELADDLRRWLDDRPIRARRPSVVQRLRKWARRYRTAVNAAATCLLLILLTVAGSVGWVVGDREARRQDAVQRAGEALRRAQACVPSENWPEGLRELEQAEGFLSGFGEEPLRRRARQLRHDLDMAIRLQEAHLQGTAVDDRHFDFDAQDAAYSAAFGEYGLDVDGLDPQVAGEQVRSRPIHRQLVAALDYWAAVRKGRKCEGWKQRLAVARAADPDTWRNRLRDAVERYDRTDAKVVEQLGAVDQADDWTSQDLVLLGNLTDGTALGESVIAFLRRAQRRHPGDFWINIELGDLLFHSSRPSRLEEAIRFDGIAVALRPESPGARLNLALALYTKGLFDEAEAEAREAIRLKWDYAEAYVKLGLALLARGQLDEAIAEWREAIRLKEDLPEARTNLGNALVDRGRLDEAITEYGQALGTKRPFPEAYKAHCGLGNALYAKGRLDEAIAAYREALRLKNDSPVVHSDLGEALRRKGWLEEAIAELREALRLQKDNPGAHFNLGLALYQQGRLDEVITECREALRLKKDYAEAHNTLGNALKDKGRLDEAIAEYRETIRVKKDIPEAHCNLGGALEDKADLDGAIAEYREAIRLRKDFPEAHYKLGNALSRKGRLDGAMAEYREAIRLKKDYPDAHYSLGIVLKERGQLDDAIAEYQEAIRLKKDYPEAHCNLGLVLLQQGQFQGAVEELRVGHELGSRNPLWPYPSAQWLRNAERFADLDARLPLLLRGREQPKDAGERLALAQLCQELKKLFAAAARWYGEAFAAQPALAENLQACHRYNAACAAALAGCGQGLDAGNLDAKERARLRKQALTWLQAEVAARRGQLKSWWPGAADQARQVLKHALDDPDFNGVRAEHALGMLPEAERADWQKLWQEVEALRQRAARPPDKAAATRP